jgi:glycosyltransferase involved in cell wall biosynthesis
VVRTGDTGLLVPPKDAEALAAALLALLQDRELARRLGRAGQARVAAEFSRERFQERVGALYQRVLRRPLRHALVSQARS